MRLLFLLPLLVGCSQSELPALQRTLDRYAELTAQGGSLESVLSGEALESAEKSNQLLESLGLSQSGLAKFELLAADEGMGKGCLDVSAVELFNQKGERVSPTRSDRVEFAVQYENDFSITSLSIGDQPC